MIFIPKRSDSELEEIFSANRFFKHMFTSITLCHSVCFLLYFTGWFLRD